uniref:DUS-like FMN-binding domain-containing protein n=1 Tax=Grammatophora oceanica TaxID=210454 RepID=A0A7S1VKR7_9STRA|mmetsp:Transcript_4906/g.6840  ORF Transcript_4906/g.6840 Transcript_4906/m.6840 type:complete len:509 (+) Transcript_4906:50-1576(+)
MLLATMQIRRKYGNRRAATAMIACLCSTPNSSAAFHHHKSSTPPSTTATKTASAAAPNFSWTLDDDGRPIKYVAAPMVAQSDRAFRMLCRNHGADLCFTQMHHSRNIVNDATFAKKHVDWTEQSETDLMRCQKDLLAGLGKYQRDDAGAKASGGEGGPLMVQLAGHDPQTVVDAALLLLDKDTRNDITGFDLNLGCPQAIAKKGMYGAFLAEHDFDVVCDVLTALRNSLPSEKVVSAKIRLPPAGDQVLKERVTRLCEQAGIDLLTVHGRTLHENKVSTGAVHLHGIRLAVEVARAVRGPSFPVIANGGMETNEDVHRIVHETGASAAMSSEALLERPNIFTTPILEDRRQIFEQQLGFARDYLDLCQSFPPLPGVSVSSFSVIKSHLFKMLHRYIQQHHDLRITLAKHGKTHQLVHAYEIVDQLEERYESDQALLQCSSCDANSSYYRRHWGSADLRHSRTKQKIRRLEQPEQDSQQMSLSERKQAMQKRIELLREQNANKRMGATV